MEEQKVLKKNQLKREIEKKLRASNAQDKLEISLLRGDKILLEGQVENQLMIIEQQKNEITTLNKKIEFLDRTHKSINKMAARILVRKIVTMYNKGTSIDKLVDMLIKFLEK